MSTATETLITDAEAQVGDTVRIERDRTDRDGKPYLFAVTGTVHMAPTSWGSGPREKTVGRTSLTRDNDRIYRIEPDWRNAQVIKIDGTVYSNVDPGTLRPWASRSGVGGYAWHSTASLADKGTVEVIIDSEGNLEA